MASPRPSHSSGSAASGNDIGTLDFYDMLGDNPLETLYNDELVTSQNFLPDLDLESINEEAVSELNNELCKNISVVNKENKEDDNVDIVEMCEESTNVKQKTVTSRPNESPNLPAPTRHTLRVQDSQISSTSLQKAKTSPLHVFLNGKPAKNTFASKMSPASISSKYDVDDDRSRKAAVQAKIRRENKKAYISGLEQQVGELTEENAKLGSTNKKLEKERNQLLEEVQYLKNILANDSKLSDLLKNIDTVDGVHLSSSFARKRSMEHDHDDDKAPKRGRPSENGTMSSGICLHVENNNNVSLEFCYQCAKMSKATDRCLV